MQSFLVRIVFFSWARNPDEHSLIKKKAVWKKKKMTKIPERYRKVTADQWTSTEGGEVREWESRKRATINQSKWNHFVSHFFQLPPNLSCCSPFKFRWPSAQISYPFFFSFLFSVLSSFYFSDSPRNQGTVEGMGFFFTQREAQSFSNDSSCLSSPIGSVSCRNLRRTPVRSRNNGGTAFFLGLTGFHRVSPSFSGF